MLPLSLSLFLSPFQLSLFVSADPKTQALLVKSLSKLVSLRIKRRGKKPFEIQLSVRFSRLFGGFVPLSVRTWSRTRCLLTCLRVCARVSNQMCLFNCKMTGRSADKPCVSSADLCGVIRRHRWPCSPDNTMLCGSVPVTASRLSSPFQSGLDGDSGSRRNSFSPVFFLPYHQERV